MSKHMEYKKLLSVGEIKIKNLGAPIKFWAINVSGGIDNILGDKYFSGGADKILGDKYTFSGGAEKSYFWGSSGR